jgi:RNA ligase
MKGRLLEVLFRDVRPTGNVLPGYVPSYALGRVSNEAG